MAYKNTIVTQDIRLAPMEGVSDLPFRLWINLTSTPSHCSTPFLRVTPTFPKAKIPREFAPELSILKDYVNYSLTPQLMGASPEDIIRVGEPLLKVAPFIDLNCGCPSPNAVGSKAGSSLLKDPGLFEAFIQKVSTAFGPGKLSLKMRTGFHSHAEFPTLLESLKSIPLAQLSLHGRTRDQRYDGLSRWHLIEMAAQSLPYPVAGSGDIFSTETLNSFTHAAPSVGQVLIGRGALRNPWIFTELKLNATQDIQPEAIVYCLACLAILYQTYLTDFDLLIEMVKSGLFLSPCGTEQEAWKKKFRDFMTLQKSSLTISDLGFEPFVLGRVKMVWNYMRSGLPSALFSPQILRSKSFQSLRKQILDCSQETTAILKHNPKLDWIYTSKKKPPALTDHLFS